MSYYVFKTWLFVVVFSGVVLASELTHLPDFSYKLNNNQLELSLDLPANLYLNSDSLQVFVDDKMVSVELVGEQTVFQKHNVFKGKVGAKVDLLKNNFAQVRVGYQGCSVGGICYPPQMQEIAGEKFSWVVLLTLFFSGVMLAFTPCAIPIAPLAIASICGGENARQLVKAFGFLLGLTISYACLGFVIYWLGIPLQQFAQMPVVLVVFSIFVLIMALALLEVNQSITTFVYSIIQKMLPARQVDSGFVASLMGAITMLVATPCVAPPMLAALAWASQANNAWPATLGLASLGLGLGAPATIAAVCGVRLARNGGSSNILQLIIGGSLTLLVLILLSRVVGHYFFIGLIIIWLGLIGLVVRKYLCEFGAKKTLPLFVLVLVSGFVISYFMPAKNAEHLLGYTKFSQNDSLVVKQKQFVGSVIYFHADWCSSCRNLERSLLINTDITNDLQQWQKFAIDLTSGSKSELLLQKKWRVIGPPTLLLFNADGKLVQSLAGEISFKQLHKALSLSKLTVKP